MPVYLPTAVVGNKETLITLGHAGEIMGWFHPSKDQPQNVYQGLPCVYVGEPGHGRLFWTWGDEWEREQRYLIDSNICVTSLRSELLGMALTTTDLVPESGACLRRHISVTNNSAREIVARVFLYGDWNMGGVRTGNGLRYDHGLKMLLQWHREVALAIGGSALEMWQCGKAGAGWNSNALRDLNDGHLQHQDLEIGDVDWAFGFHANLHPGAALDRSVTFALASHQTSAVDTVRAAEARVFDVDCATLLQSDARWLEPGIRALREAGPEDALADELVDAYKRSLLCLPLLCGPEGVAIAAPEFDPEFVSCGGYGYFWPRDGAEFISGLMDAGYPEFAVACLDWCAAAQDPSGLWEQRYFLNGQPGPNWCLAPDALQIDQVGAVLWGLGKWIDHTGAAIADTHAAMVRRAADYLVSRLSEKGVHGNAFDTWETFVGSFTYSNASIHAGLSTAARVLDEQRYRDAARRLKDGVLKHFLRDDAGYPYLVRGFHSDGTPDSTVDSSSLGAIEPFALLDLDNDHDLAIAEGTFRAIRERLEVDWEGGRAIRRFEGDAYVGGVPACVNTLWMARCALVLSARLRSINRSDEARSMADRAEVYLKTVLRRATPTGLLPELMQGPTGQRYWAAPHGWAMASFVSGVLLLARERKAQQASGDYTGK